jgi:hypothetical protein
VTEGERLHLVEQIGAIMDTSEPEKGNEEQSHEVIIHIHSPDNRIAARDYIEVNINLGEKASRKRAGQDAAMPAAIPGPAEVGQLLENAAEILFAMGQQRIQMAQPTKNTPIEK